MSEVKCIIRSEWQYFLNKKTTEELAEFRRKESARNIAYYNKKKEDPDFMEARRAYKREYDRKNKEHE